MKTTIARGPIIAMAALMIIVIGSGSSAFGQRSRSRAASTKTEVRAAAEAVSIQVKNLSKFLFVMGGVAKGIDDLDKEIREGRGNRELEAQNRQYKDDVVRSVRALRAGLVKLEVDFRAKPALRPYLKYIQGITGDSALAEDLAVEGKFTASGRQLLMILEKLADVLVELP